MKYRLVIGADGTVQTNVVRQRKKTLVRALSEPISMKVAKPTTKPRKKAP